MPDQVTLEQVEAMAVQLSPTDQLRLVEKVVKGLLAQPSDTSPPPRRSWSEIRGIVDYPLCGEDAQTWVSRTRQEADEQREKQWRREP